MEVNAVLVKSISILKPWFYGYKMIGNSNLGSWVTLLSKKQGSHRKKETFVAPK